MRNVLGQLAQTNLAAAWAIFGKNRPISKKSVHLTSQSSTAQKKTVRNVEPFRRAACASIIVNVQI